MKQLLRYFLFLITVGAMFSACQKELNFETENAVGTLVKDVNNNCAPFTVNGSYVKAIALDASNYVDVQVNITNVGNYVIRTNTVNGYYFYDSSTVAVLGNNTFRLKGYGTPLAASIDDFTVTFGTTTCSLSNIVLATAGGTTVAQFTLAGSPNACAGSKQTNNFFAGVATAAALNKDTIYVDVTVAGTYTITATTTPSNGLTFSKSGTFTAIGPNQQVILEASGTPSTAGSIPYTINTTSPASNCGFNLTVLGAATFTMNCGGVTFGGLYREGTPIVAGTNTIIIPISGVIANGFYNVTTSTLNGISFAGAGALTPASTSITLYALPGTPITQGSFIYNVAVGGGLPCGIVVNYMAPPPQAFYTINCGAAAIQTGTFQAGSALNASSKVTISVSPGTLGAYTITTDTLNGVSYKAVGIFTTVFTQNVDLIANPVNNLPAAAGTFTHRTYGGTAVCNNLSVSYSAGGVAGFIRANIDGSTTLTTFNINASGNLDITTFPGSSTLQITGSTNSTSSSPLILLSVNKTGNIVGNTTFAANSTTNAAQGQYDATPSSTFNASFIGGSLTINITSITTTPPKRVVGTFSGTLRDNFGLGTNTAVFTNGNFDVPYQ